MDVTADRTIHHGDTPLTVSRPVGHPAAGLIVLHEAWGLTSHIESVVRGFAAEGYLTVAPHLYHRRGVAAVAGDDFRRARPLLASLTSASIDADLSAAIAALRPQVDRIGVVGFCMGGTIALWAAAHAAVDAAVTYYGGGVASPRWDGIESGLDSARRLRVPWLGLYGDRDRSIPVTDVERLRAATQAASVPGRIVRYPHAGHAFASAPGSSEHVSAAADDAQIRTRRFLAEHLRR